MTPPSPASARCPGRARLAVLGVSGAVIIVGLMVGLWGWADWKGFFHHPARALLIAMLVGRFLHTAFFAHPSAVSRGRPETRVPEPVFFPLIYLFCLLALASPYFDRREQWILPGGDLVRYPGLILAALGLGLATWGQAHLGRFFSGSITLQEDHRLVTDGPFRFVRHPRYAGLILVFLGMPLVFRSVAGLVAGGVCALLFLRRIPREEALLASAFPEEWPAYARRTGRLLPRAGWRNG